ncbi:MAG: heme d1 biosynthesis radical SAM protein NirJ [Gammaproteobacteria bacterium]|nr:heme d1 biosynthesis radical SAM protein NirJ [Gammaproteobacteria bacterium]
MPATANGAPATGSGPAHTSRHNAALGGRTGPVVIWNLIRRCNLTCKHCYSISADTDFPGELSTEEVYRVMDDLKAFHVPVLILSGGEPLMRADIFDISRRAKQMGFYVGLSTNGTLINDSNIERIAAIGYDYVGISIDGIEQTHDRFRRMEGAFDASMNAIRLCHARGIKVGMRFTMTQDNAKELPELLDLMEQEGIDKFYLSHLNYAGRGNINRKDDVILKTTRWAMNLLFDTAWKYVERGGHDVQGRTSVAGDRMSGATKEFVTGNNDADGVYLLFWVRRHFPQLEQHMRAKLAQWGGNSSGVNIANIDNLGNIHPDTFWWHYTLGNVKERPFSQIWQDVSDPLMAGLKANPRAIKGRCGACRHFDICGGNTRVRAHQLTGDPWAEDPACYLTDEEIGVEGLGERLQNRPYTRIPIAATNK